MNFFDHLVFYRSLTMKLLFCTQLLVLLKVGADLFERFSTKVSVDDILRTIPSSTATSCVLSCKNSQICKQPALTEAGVCIHLRRVFTSSVDVELFQPVEQPLPQTGKTILFLWVDELCNFHAIATIEVFRYKKLLVFP